MATVEQMEKKRSRQIVEILEAVNDLQASFMKTVTVEGEVLETTIQADELQAEILKAEFYNLKQQVAELSGQVAELSGQVAELKIILTTSAPTSRRSKK